MQVLKSLEKSWKSEPGYIFSVRINSQKFLPDRTGLNLSIRIPRFPNEILLVFHFPWGHIPKGSYKRIVSMKI